MNPTEPEKRISRRSSILKLPKVKSSSENGDQAVPVDESPRKYNRRVSFSGKKHIKEFWGTTDQGTLWDSTYEESDSSHMKTSQASLNNVTPPLNSTSGNCPIENTNNQFDNLINQQLQELPRATNYYLDETNDTLVLLKNKRQLNCKNQLASNNNDLNIFIDKENIPISMEPEKIESSLVEDDIIQPNNKFIDKIDNILPGFSIYCDDEQDENLQCSKDNTICGEQSMDCTLTANQLQISSDNYNIISNNHNNNNNLIDNNNASKEMEITDNISSNIYKQKNTIDDKTQYFEQNEMVMTMALPSVIDKQKLIDNKNHDLTSNNRMSITTAVPSILHRPVFNEQTGKLHQSQMENSLVFNNKKISDDQNKIFNENRMSMTTAIPSILTNQPVEDRTMFFQQERMDTTQAIPSLLHKVGPYEQNQVCNQNRMSMTTMIPSVLEQPMKRNQQRNNRQSIMEMTEAIPSVLSQNKDEESSIVNQNRMSMTTMVPSVLEQTTMKRNQQQNNCQTIMEMTEAIPSVLSQNKDDESSIVNQNRMSMTTMVPSVLEQTTMKRNQQRNNRQSIMEMTEAIPSVLSQNKDEESSIVNQNRMSMTTMVPSVLEQTTMKRNQQQNNCQTIMEMTEAIPSVLSQNKDDESSIVNQNRMSMTTMVPLVLEQTTMKRNQQRNNRQSIMEMTEAIPSVLSQNKDEESSIVNQNRMSMTTMVPSVLKQTTMNRNHQQNNCQTIMEMTEALPSVLRQNKDRESSIVNQNRMSMTTMVPSVLQHQTTKINQQRNNRQSIMEMTEAIPSVLSQNKDEESEMINQNQMSMTTAVPSILHKQTINVNQTINQNPMEFTEALPSVLNQHKNIDNQNRMTVINSTLTSPSRLINQVPSANNYLDEITEPSLSLKRNYTIIRSPQHSRNIELASPHPKLQINETSGFQKNNPTTNKDREKLHRILHKSLLEVEYLSPIPKQCKNISMELTAAVSSKFVNNQNTTDEMNSIINDVDNSKEANKSILTIVNSTIIPDIQNDLSIEKNHVSSIVNSTIKSEDKINEKNPVELINTPKITNDINDKIIPAIKQTEISSDSSSLHEQKYEPIDNNNLTDKSVARELFDANENLSSTTMNLNNNNNNNLSTTNNESIACRDYYDNTIDQITRPFSSPAFNINTETTKTIRIIPNCFENSEYNHSLTIPIIQQLSNDNLDAIKEPSFFVNSTESVEVNAIYENEITNNIKIWEKKNIQQVEETKKDDTVENINKTIDDSQENINNNGEKNIEQVEEIEKDTTVVENMNKTIDDNEDNLNINNNEINILEKPQENISNFFETIENHNMKIKNSKKRSSLDICDNKKITENTKRFKLNNYLQSTNDEVFNSNIENKTQEMLIDQQNDKLPTEIIESLETKEFLLKCKCKLNNINSIITKNNIFLNKVMKDIENKKKQLLYYEEKMNQFAIIDNKKDDLNDNFELIEENDNTRFGILKKNIKNYENKRECIWKIISIDQNRIIIEYYKTTIWLVIGFDVPDNTDEIETIKGIKIIPRLHPDELPILKITDKLIFDTINVEKLKNKYKTYDDVIKMIEVVDNEVKSIYDFYHELIKLERKNLMDINVDKITFVSRTSKMRIILRITINVKIFTQITPDDITVDCLLGNVDHSHIKDLIKNFKKNHKFLKFYMDDVRNYIELLEEAQRPKNI